MSASAAPVGIRANLRTTAARTEVGDDGVAADSTRVRAHLRQATNRAAASHLPASRAIQIQLGRRNKVGTTRDRRCGRT